MIIKIYNSFIFYNDNNGIVNDYYQYIVDLLKKILFNHPNLNINISFGNKYIWNNNNNKSIYIDINYEHTLVKQGGRDIPQDTPFGNIPDDNNNKYYIRLLRYNELDNADIIIDYSIPNIYNVKQSHIFQSISKKHIYISSSIYKSYFIKHNREINSLTTFINIHEPRRNLLLKKLNKNNISHININNCFNKESLENIYKNTKILINIHQTDHHHTLEELRILPALQCGVIVICEYSPLNKLVPYNDYIIFESYDNIINKVIDVINNYDYYFNYIFLTEKKINLNELDIINYNTLNNKIISLV